MQNNLGKIGQKTGSYYFHEAMSEVSLHIFHSFICLVFFTRIIGGCIILPVKTGHSRSQRRVQHLQILLPGEIQNILQFTGRYRIWARCFFFLSWTKKVAQYTSVSSSASPLQLKINEKTNMYNISSSPLQFIRKYPFQSEYITPIFINACGYPGVHPTVSFHFF